MHVSVSSSLQEGAINYENTVQHTCTHTADAETHTHRHTFSDVSRVQVSYMVGNHVCRSVTYQNRGIMNEHDC